MKYGLRKTISWLLAVLFLILGAIGVVLPIVPSIPLFLLASFFFGRGTKQFY